MEKILLVIDAQELSIAALDFACYLGRLTKSQITGVFLENLVGERRVIAKPVHSNVSAAWEAGELTAERSGKTIMTEKNIEFFKEACAKRSVPCKIHRDRHSPAKEIITESRYADLIVVDAATSFKEIFEGTPTAFVKDILKDAECPVIIAPSNFEAIDEIVFAYDGSKSAAFAIKQFSYLLPQLDDRKIILLQINESGVWADRDKYILKEWLQNRYSAIGFQTLKGSADDKLFDYFIRKKNVLIVMGSYGRNAISRFFKRSHADRLMRTITHPLFISHY